MSSIRRIQCAIGMVTLVSLPSLGASGQVNRCVDPAGKIEYRTAPCEGTAPLRSPPVAQAPREPTRPSPGSPLATPQFGPSVAPVNARELPVLQQTPPRDWAADAELVVVSGYEPSVGGTRVRLNRPGKRVLLVLSSYEKILWRVEPSPGTRISGIVLASHAGTSGVVADVPVPVHQVQLPYAYDTDNIKFRQMLAQLNAWFGTTRIDAVHGQYRLAPVVEIATLTPPRAELTSQGVSATAPTTPFDFDLLTRDHRKAGFRNDGTPKAPRPGLQLVSGSKTALSTSGREVYTLSGDGLQVTETESGQRSQVPLPTDFPSFSWATAVAYDTDLDIVTVVTLGGEGFLYRYDARRKRWLDHRSLNQVDITSLAYDPVGKRYAAWTSEGILLFISSKGEALGSKSMRTLMPGFGALYDAGNGRPPALLLAPRGPQTALVHVQDGAVSMIWTYDERSGQTTLTYKRPMAGTM